MRADIHGGQEHKRSVQGPDTEAQDLSPPNPHFPLATRGRSIQKCQKLTRAVQQNPRLFDHLVGTQTGMKSRSDALEDLYASYPDGTAIWTRVCCDPSCGYGSRADKTS